MTKLILAALFIAAFVSAPATRAQSPSALTGKWHIVLDTEGGDRENNTSFEQDGEKVTGKWDVDGDKAGGTPFTGSFADKTLTLEFAYDSSEVGPGTMKLKGKVGDDGAMSGNWEFQSYSGTFKATRLKAADTK